MGKQMFWGWYMSMFFSFVLKCLGLIGDWVLLGSDAHRGAVVCVNWGQRLPGVLDETSSKLRCQKSAENDEKHYILSPSMLLVIKKKGKREERSCLLLTLEVLKTERTWDVGEWESLNEAFSMGQITCIFGVHTDFIKLISKQQLGGKGQAETHEDRG